MVHQQTSYRISYCIYIGIYLIEQWIYHRESLLMLWFERIMCETPRKLKQNDLFETFKHYLHPPHKGNMAYKVGMVVMGLGIAMN